MRTLKQLQEQLITLMSSIQKQGADAADGVVLANKSFNLNVRLGKIENVESSNDVRLGLRVIIGKSQACVTSHNFQDLSELADRALSMARVMPEDPYCGLADPTQLTHTFPLMTVDTTEPTFETLKNYTLEAEEAALAVSGVTQSDGAHVGWSQRECALVASNGFQGHYRSSSFGTYVSVLAGQDTQMQQDGYMDQRCFWDDLASPQTIGRMAGERACRHLNPRRIQTCKVPVVYDNLTSPRLLQNFIGGITGSSIAQRTSFLQDALGKAVFPQTITIVDDPTRPRSPGSRSFDGEGLPAQKRLLVDQGVLQTWLLNLHTARQLGLSPTGHATAVLGGPPGIGYSNLFIEPGTVTLEELLCPIAKGLFVTDLFGHSVNGLTGDYSLGAKGLWIENGHISHPVQGITISGNLRDMFRECAPANDLEFKGSCNAPSLRIEQMTVAGDS